MADSIDVLDVVGTFSRIIWVLTNGRSKVNLVECVLSDTLISHLHICRIRYRTVVGGDTCYC